MALVPADDPNLYFLKSTAYRGKPLRDLQLVDHAVELQWIYAFAMGDQAACDHDFSC